MGHHVFIHLALALRIDTIFKKTKISMVLGSFFRGSCVHPRCITCIELVHRELSLVKWTLSTKPDRTLFVAREVLAGPVGLDDLLKYS